MKLILGLISTLLVVSGCQTKIQTTQYGNYIPITDLATVELKEQLEIAPGQARVFIQHGAVTRGRDEYDVFCAFEIDELKEKPQYIEPGTFSVKRVQSGATEVVQAFPIKVASNTRLAAADYSPPMISYYYHFYLDSDQPNLFRMSCYGPFDIPSETDYPVLDQINKTLSGIAKLNP